MAHNKNDLVQREYNFAIVDEVDSILIDEARTPLIISQPTVESEDFIVNSLNCASNEKDVDYTVDEKLRAINSLTDEGITQS